MDVPKEVLDWLHETASEKSRYQLDLVNVLDVKGGLLLAIIALFSTDPLRAFPATTTIHSAIPHILLTVYAVILFGAAVFCVAELWPRRYRRDPLPDEDARWVSQLTEHYEKYPVENLKTGEAVRMQIANAMIERISERVTANEKLNASKIRRLSAAFYCTVFALAVYLVALLALKGV